MRKHLTKDQEFDILKIVLDKFLWLGIAIVAYGLWNMVNSSKDIWYGLVVVLCGAILMLLFMLMIIKEYNYTR